MPSPLDDFDFSSGAPMRKAWPDGFPIVRPGDRVRVTHLTAVRGRGDAPPTPAGTVVEGEARDVARDGFFDVYPDAGEPVGFDAGDETIRVEVLPRAEP